MALYGIFALALVLGACSDGSGQPDGGMGGVDAGPIECNVTAPTECIEPAPTYETDIKPILQARCVSCHYGMEGGPWPLTEYSHVTDWSGDIRARMLTCGMPPPDAGIEMPTAEREKILMWIRCGAPEQ